MRVLPLLLASYGLVAPPLAVAVLVGLFVLVTQQSDWADYGTPLWTTIDALITLGHLTWMALLALAPLIWLTSVGGNVALAVHARGNERWVPTVRIMAALNALVPLAWVGTAAALVACLFWLLQDFRL